MLGFKDIWITLDFVLKQSEGMEEIWKEYLLYCVF